ncbi:aromatic compound dioxygenase [Auriculariales sp. MPI-PUGE-AT-0066]|nr:aromatic compound dioxygenase [Auriculariales sp. MPI-PUGE-AT-0066]
MMKAFFLLSLFAISALGHGVHEEPEDIALFRRNNLNERHEIQKRCAGTLSSINKRRVERRGFSGPEVRADEEVSPLALCTMVGQTTEGPYYINNELFRTNVTDGQAGVPLKLHLTIMDVATCAILPSAFVEIWSANATGYYSGFTGSTNAKRAPQSGPFDGADKAGSGGGGRNATDNLTFQRGVAQANANGEVTINANVPGWYTGRAVHIHVRVFENSTVASNGTFVSKSGTLHHTGQIYFDQDVVDSVAKLSPYSSNKLAYASATTNARDGIYPYSTYGGYNPNLDTSLLGSTLANGLLGEIVITINRTYTSPMLSTAVHTRRADLPVGEDED